MLVVQAERTFCSRWSFDLLAWNVPCEWQDTKGRRLSSSATSASMCEGLLNSVARYFPKARFLHAATKQSIIALRSCLPIKRSCKRRNDERARTCILRNFRMVWKWKRFYVGMIVVRKRNVNFLLAATVYICMYKYRTLLKCTIYNNVDTLLCLECISMDLHTNIPWNVNTSPDIWLGPSGITAHTNSPL